MSVEMIEVEVWVLVDANGNAAADCDPDHLKDEYEADYGEALDPQTPSRVVKIKLRIPAPAPVELAAEVPAEANAGTIAVA